jgi:hypothetical protein
VTERLAFALAVMLALSPRVALAIDGNELLQSCEARGEPAAYCMGYIAGVADALRGAPYNDICPPSTANYRQMRDVAVKKLHDQPEIRHHHAAHIVGVALMVAFPCDKQGTQPKQ